MTYLYHNQFAFNQDVTDEDSDDGLGKKTWDDEEDAGIVKEKEDDEKEDELEEE